MHYHDPVVFSILALFAIIPGLGLLYYFKKKDQYQPEPWRIIWITFFLSGLFLIGAAMVEEAALCFPLLGCSMRDGWGLARYCFFVVALSEELCKFFAIRLYAYRRPEFDEEIDGIVYGAAAGAGFATVENLIYVLQMGFAVGVARALLAVPLHLFTGGLLGYGLAKKKLEGAAWAVPLTLLVAVFCHGLYDFVLFYQKIQAGHPSIFLSFGVVIFLFVYTRKTLLKTAERSRLQFAPERSSAFSIKKNVYLKFFYIALAVLFALLALLALFAVVGDWISGRKISREEIIGFWIIILPSILGGPWFLWRSTKR
jgi:RsiW-degrading membrane proteinase PrsW (M82 family)